MICVLCSKYEIITIFPMFECSCGKTYKYASGLNNHKEKCGAAAPVAPPVAPTPTPTTTSRPVTSLASDAAAAIHAETKAIVAAAAMASSARTTTNSTNVGNEEHNASFNINYVPRSEETQQVVRAITAVANEYCKGRIIVTSDEPAPGSSSLTGISTSVNADGTTVYNHPTRTISIIETPPEEVSPEEEHDITLEKMTYLILSLIQNNTKLTKENQLLRSIVAKIDPECFED
jgi:hypothetical protein